MKNKDKKEIKFIVTYARVSTSLQEDQETIKNQTMALEEYTKENNLEIVASYKDEGWSGVTLERPELDQLRQDAKNRVWDAVLIYDPDRLSRRYSHQELLMDELKEIGINTLFVTIPTPKSIDDKMLYGMRGLFAEYERTKIAERFRLGKVSRVKSGHILTTEAPYGYTYILNKGKKGTVDYIPGHYVVNEREAKVVREIFSWVANEGLTVRAVVKRLQKLGIHPRKSKRGVWGTSTLCTMLRRETYIGIAYWRKSKAVVPVNPIKDEKYKKVKKSSRRVRPKEEWFSIPVPAIINKDLFERAGEKLKSNFATLGRNRKYEYLLSGRVRCDCGHTRTGCAAQKGKHLYYRCSDRTHSFPLPPTCSEGSINARIADELLWERIKLILTSPDLILKQIDKWNSKCKNVKLNSSTIDIKSTQNEINKLQRREDKMANLYSKEMITLEKFEEYVFPIRKEIKQLENQISKAKLEKAPKNELLLIDKKDIVSFSKEIKKFLDNLNFLTKQAIVRHIINNITMNQKSLQVYGYLNLSEIYVALLSENRNCWITEYRKIYFV